jgi:acyl dehydratase
MTSTKTDQSVAGATANDTLFFEDLRVGDHWFSGWREITAEDVADFAELTGDHDPLHTNQVVDSPFGEPVAHGLLGLSVLAGLSTEHPRAATLALIGIRDWSFDRPVFFGDRVRVLTKVEQLAPHGRRAGRVTWIRQLVNQDELVVQHGRIETLVGRRSRLQTRSTHPSNGRNGR